jgi:hypothetical protein
MISQMRDVWARWVYRRHRRNLVRAIDAYDLDTMARMLGGEDIDRHTLIVTFHKLRLSMPEFEQSDRYMSAHWLSHNNMTAMDGSNPFSVLGIDQRPRTH